MEAIIFYLLQAIIIFCALSVVCVSSPIYAALFLVLSMIGVAGIFVHLDAFFLAGVQLIVYAGAVTVLFVMVVMMFNLSEERKAFSKGFLGNSIKVITGLLFYSLIWSAVEKDRAGLIELPKIAEGSEQMKALASHLFTKYVFGFEAICILLLLVIVGTVSLSKAKGGTHDGTK